MNAKKLIKELVIKWTKKAQSSAYTDEERAVYYECARELHEQDLEEEKTPS